MLGCARPKLAVRWLLSLSSISAAALCYSDLQKALRFSDLAPVLCFRATHHRQKHDVQFCSHQCFSCAGCLWGHQRRVAESFCWPGRLPFKNFWSCLQSGERGLTCTARCSFVPYSWCSCAQTSHWLKALRRVMLVKKDRATRALLFSSTDSCHCLQHCSTSIDGW